MQLRFRFFHRFHQLYSVDYSILYRHPGETTRLIGMEELSIIIIYIKYTSIFSQDAPATLWEDTKQTSSVLITIHLGPLPEN